MFSLLRRTPNPLTRTHTLKQTNKHKHTHTNTHTHTHRHRHHHHHHLFLNCEGHWGTTDDFATSFLHFSLFSSPLGLGELQACPFPDIVVPPLPLSALPSSPFHCALQDGFGQTWWTGNMTIPLQFASFYDPQEIFMWFNCLLDLGTVPGCIKILKFYFLFYAELIAANFCVPRQMYLLCPPPPPAPLLFCCCCCFWLIFQCNFSVFVYVIVMHVKMPRCNFSDETKKCSWILNLWWQSTAQQHHRHTRRHGASLFFFFLKIFSLCVAEVSIRTKTEIYSEFSEAGCQVPTPLFLSLVQSFPRSKLNWRRLSASCRSQSPFLFGLLSR